jgi:hypothetical protein
MHLKLFSVLLLIITAGIPLSAQDATVTPSGCLRCRLDFCPGDVGLFYKGSNTETCSNTDTIIQQFRSQAANDQCKADIELLLCDVARSRADCYAPMPDWFQSRCEGTLNCLNSFAERLARDQNVCSIQLGDVGDITVPPTLPDITVPPVTVPEITAPPIPTLPELTVPPSLTEGPTPAPTPTTGADQNPGGGGVVIQSSANNNSIQSIFITIAIGMIGISLLLLSAGFD